MVSICGVLYLKCCQSAKETGVHIFACAASTLNLDAALWYKLLVLSAQKVQCKMSKIKETEDTALYQ